MHIFHKWTRWENDGETRQVSYCEICDRRKWVSDYHVHDWGRWRQVNGRDVFGKVTMQGRECNICGEVELKNYR